MINSEQPSGPSAYRVLVEGHLDQHWASWFGDLALTQETDGTTSMTGAVADQAELHGLLAKIRDLGVTLISVQRVGSVGSAQRPRT